MFIFLLNCNVSNYEYNDIKFSNDRFLILKDNISFIEEAFDYLLSIGVSRYRLKYYFDSDSTLVFIDNKYSYKNGIINLSTSNQTYSILDKLDKAKVSRSINILKDFGISACFYREELYDYAFRIGFDGYQPGRMRYFISLPDLKDTVKYKNHYYKIFDIRDNLILIGEP